MPANLRFAIRSLLRAPGFSAIVILILAVGIGANTVMYTLVDHVLLRPLRYPHPDRLFAIQETADRLAGWSGLPVNAMHFGEWRKRWSSAESAAMLSGTMFNLTSDGDPLRVYGARVSASMFPMLGVQPQLGRNFLEDEDRAGHDAVVILSDSFWERRFHRDRQILGRKILLDGIPYEVVGILPESVQIPRQSHLYSLAGAPDFDPEIWKPFAIRDEELASFGDFNYGGLARLKPGVAASQALDELNAIQASIDQGFSEPVKLRAVLTPLQQQMTGRSRQGLLLLLAAVGSVLLIICVNLANLLLARSTTRRRELAIRAALGAGRGRLLGQALTESLLLAIPGGAIGVALASWSLGAVVAAAPQALPRATEIHIDLRILLFAVGASILCGVLFGLLPAWRSARTDPQEGLRGASRSATDSRQGARVRALLVALEVALSTVCLVAAGLLLNSFVRLLHVDSGFDVERVLTANISLPATRYANLTQRDQFFQKVIERVRTLPGVIAAGVTNRIPVTGEGSNNWIIVEGNEAGPASSRPSTDYRTVSEDYLTAMGIPLRQGRFFTRSDHGPVVLVSERVAEQLWPGRNPIGKRFHIGSPRNPLLEIIGVVGDVRNVSLEKAPGLAIYIPHWQRDRADMILVMRTALDPAALTQAVRTEIRALDAELPAVRLRTMQEVVSAGVAERRFQLTLVLVFAGVALALASLGIFGVVSYTTAQRRGEMGIRLALGATSADLRSLVLRQGLAPVAIGLATGIAGALGLGRALAGLLYGVKPSDPLTIAGVAVVLFAVAAIACYIPALRASRSDPLNALRYE